MSRLTSGAPSYLQPTWPKRWLQVRPKLQPGIHRPRPNRSKRPLEVARTSRSSCSHNLYDQPRRVPSKPTKDPFEAQERPSPRRGAVRAKGRSEDDDAQERSRRRARTRCAKRPPKLQKSKDPVRMRRGTSHDVCERLATIRRGTPNDCDEALARAFRGGRRPTSSTPESHPARGPSKASGA